MGLQPPPRGPLIGLVVVIDIAQHEAAVHAVNDQPDVAGDPHGPEVLVPRLVELVQFHARLRRVELQVEGGGLDGLLLVAGQAGEAGGEGVGDAEFHQASPAMSFTLPRKTCTSSWISSAVMTPAMDSRIK